MEVQGPGLTLRTPRDDDAPALLALASDPRVTNWFSWGPYRSIEEPAGYIARLAGERERGERLDLLIVHDERGPAGITGFGELSVRDRRAVIGTWLGREHWGTGVNTDAKALMLKLAFTELGLERVGAYTNPENARSLAALEKVGFRREGTLRRFHRHGDERHDVHVLSMLREDWMRTPLADVAFTLTGDVPPAFVVR